MGHMASQTGLGLLLPTPELGCVRPSMLPPLSAVPDPPPGVGCDPTPLPQLGRTTGDMQTDGQTKAIGRGPETEVQRGGENGRQV